MALKTQGFALSALPRAPRIPGNVGVVDVKAIYDGVKQGLDAFETARRAPRSMLLADAQMQAATEQAPLATRGVLAQTEAAEQQLPIRTALLATQERKLAAEATPEFIDAKIQSMLRSLQPANVREFELMTAHLTPPERERARAIALGLIPRQSSAAIQYKEVVGPDGRTVLVAVDPRAVGAQVVGSGQTYGSGVPTPGMPAAQVPVAADTAPAIPTQAAQVEVDELGNPIGAAPAIVVEPSTSAPAQAPRQPTQGGNLFASPTIGEKKSQEVTGAKTAEMVVEAKAKLPKARAAFDSLQAKTERVEKDIDQALALANDWSTGFGALLKNIPKTEAKRMASLLASIKGNLGFDALAEMRANSPTGGALGQITDFENRLLQATIADLDQSVDVPFFKAQLEKVRKARSEALERLNNQIDREVRYFGLTDSDFSVLAEKAKQPIPLPSSGEFKIVEIK